MPPKGWRKNAEGQYPSPSRDTELNSIDDILFPRATVQKIAKLFIAEDKELQMMLSKESVQALQRSATVFVSHILHHARKVSKESARRTVAAPDIFTALERAEFAGIVPEIRQGLSQFEADVALKKKLKAEGKLPPTEPVAKKLKSDTGESIITNVDEGEEEDEVEDEQNADMEVDQKVEAVDYDSVEEDGEVEIVQNPHQALEADFVELEKSQEQEHR